MDRVTTSILADFSKEHGLNELTESKRFEHLASYVTVRRHYSRIFDTSDIITSGGSDTGIDGIAILVNSILITDIDILREHAEQASHFDVVFIFIQAERSSGFEATTIGNFGFGVRDFFSNAPTLIRNEAITNAAEIMSAIFDLSGKFNKNPTCHLYYVTTGKWVGDEVLEARRQAEIEDLKGLRVFSDVQFTPIDAEQLHKLYRQTRNAISRQFTFERKTVIPEIPGVQEAYLGFLPVSQYMRLITDDGGAMIGGLFYDNVRDWLGLESVEVNEEIGETLDSSIKSPRFVLMNNGITIIARTLKSSGDKFSIENYSIVNGCQTSHVLFEMRNKISEGVTVPVRLIGTQDEDIINDIIRATNRQTAVKEEQFYALEEFPKGLENYFQAFEDPYKLYYERRTNQYERPDLNIEKTRIVTPPNMIRAFASMFLNEPHRATRSYGALKAKVGTDIFGKEHQKEPYYAAAYALYKLEYLFRSGKLEGKYKNARYQILMATRILANPDPLPTAHKMNSREMKRYAEAIIQQLWDANKSEQLLTRAVKVIDSVAIDIFDRDNIRTEPFTRKVIQLAEEERSEVETI
jgi:hypothetical protein